jgi:hypothetical protein
MLMCFFIVDSSNIKGSTFFLLILSERNKYSAETLFILNIYSPRKLILINVNGKRVYLYRSVDSEGNIIDFT